MVVGGFEIFDGRAERRDGGNGSTEVSVRSARVQALVQCTYGASRGSNEAHTGRHRRRAGHMDSPGARLRLRDERLLTPKRRFARAVNLSHVWVVDSARFRPTAFSFLLHDCRGVRSTVDRAIRVSAGTLTSKRTKWSGQHRHPEFAWPYRRDWGSGLCGLQGAGADAEELGRPANLSDEGTIETTDNASATESGSPS